MLKPSLLIIGKIDYAVGYWQEIESSYGVLHYAEGSRDDFLQKCPNGHLDGIKVVCRSNQYNYLTGNFDTHLVNLLPSTTKAIRNIGSGVNTIDVTSRSRRGITVTNTPTAGKDAVADTTMCLLLGALRQASGPLSRVRQGSWQQDTAVEKDAQERVLGLCGFGTIGSTVVQRAKAFGMFVQYYSPSSERNGYSRTDAHAEAGYRSVSFDELLRKSDVISIHAPLTDNTHRVFSKPQFAMMRKGVVVINTARGPLVDQAALVEAVYEGHVWAMGMDVFDEEPDVPQAIKEDARFFVLPQVAIKTSRVRLEMEVEMLKNRVAFMDGERVPNPVNDPDT